MIVEKTTYNKGPLQMMLVMFRSLFDVFYIDLTQNKTNLSKYILEKNVKR